VRSTVDRTGSRARPNRSQFGRVIGEFQAVAHPLAIAFGQTNAARELVRLAAFQMSHDRWDVARAHLVRMAATKACLLTAATVHQAMGAVGFAVETGVGMVSSRIRQWSLLRPVTYLPAEVSTPG
jgi:alkylation response protein AidB-like acyl-CoA dehydrogenase